MTRVFCSTLLNALVLSASFLMPSWALAEQAAEEGWQAQWIGPATAAEGKAAANQWICWRKSFTLSAKPATAPARIAVDSRYWLWINGKMVVFEGGLKRGPSPNDSYYDSLDLAPYLAEGRNTIAILQWYWGKDGFSHKSSGKPGLIFEMHAGATPIVSDASWKMLLHPAYGETGDPRPNFRLAESNVHFDAGKDIGLWMAADYQDNAWTTPAALGKPPAAPWNKLVKRPIPQWRNSGLRDYVNAAELPKVGGAQAVVGKLPYNAQVTPWLKIDAPAGLKIDIRTDNYNGGGEPNIRTEYVSKEGVQEFESFAWFNGHEVRYTIPEGVKILGLKYRETGYDTDFSGSFTCDDDFYDKLWKKCQRTLYITMRDNYMDCPDRERAQWWGDAVNELGETFYSLSPSSAQLTSKAISNLVLWQRSDKTLYSPVPAGNWDKELPPQMLASVGKYGFWTYYLYTGDKQTLELAYPHVKDYLSIWKIDAAGLVEHRSGGWDWGDWGDNVDIRLLDNLWYCLALEGAARMADALGQPADATAFETRRKEVIEAVNKQMWNGEAYRAPGYQGTTDDRGNGLAVVAGAADAGKYPAIKKILAERSFASPYMEKYVLEALWLMGDADAGLARMRRRYQPIVDSACTTLPELFPSGGTYNHAWSGGPLTILSQYAAGIAPIEPGFQTYQVLPQMGGLKHIAVVVDSCRGKIGVDLKRGENSFSLKLDSPDNTTAVVGIPKGAQPFTILTINGKTVWENGQAKARLDGVTFRDADGAYIRFTVAPGSYTFTAE